MTSRTDVPRIEERHARPATRIPLKEPPLNTTFSVTAASRSSLRLGDRQKPALAGFRDELLDRRTEFYAEFQPLGRHQARRYEQGADFLRGPERTFAVLPGHRVKAQALAKRLQWFRQRHADA